MNLIEQSTNGDIFAVAYQDYGVFYVHVRDNKGVELALIEVSE
jgi:hypothetical protein